jgi:hypothetical protein
VVSDPRAARALSCLRLHQAVAESPVSTTCSTRTGATLRPDRRPARTACASSTARYPALPSAEPFP